MEHGDNEIRIAFSQPELEVVRTAVEKFAALGTRRSGSMKRPDPGGDVVRVLWKIRRGQAGTFPASLQDKSSGKAGKSFRSITRMGDSFLKRLLFNPRTLKALHTGANLASSFEVGVKASPGENIFAFSKRELEDIL